MWQNFVIKQNIKNASIASRSYATAGDRFPLPVNTGRVDGRAFPLAELTGRRSPVNSGRQLG